MSIAMFSGAKTVGKAVGEIIRRTKKKYLKSKYKKGGKGPGNTTRTTKSAQVYSKTN